MSKIKEGDIFGSFLIIKKIKSKNNKDSWFECLCKKCGTKKEVVGYSLLNGRSKSCCGHAKMSGLAERKKKIVNFLKKGYTSRDILSQVQTSFATITKIRKKLASEGVE